MQLHLGSPEPVTQFVDLRPIAIIQMLPRAKYLDCRHSGQTDLVQPDRVEPMVDEQVRR